MPIRQGERRMMMGTRAIITKNSKEFIAVHFDGYPEGLGEDLMNCFSDEEIQLAASNHTISFMAGGKKGNGMPRPDLIISSFGIKSANNYDVEDIADYNDFAEYQYDLTNGVWSFRSISGSWKEANKNGKFYPLTKEGIQTYYKGEEVS